jgi:hypothetical protein
LWSAEEDRCGGQTAHHTRRQIRRKPYRIPIPDRRVNWWACMLVHRAFPLHRPVHSFHSMAMNPGDEGFVHGSQAVGLFNGPHDYSLTRVSTLTWHCGDAGSSWMGWMSLSPCHCGKDKDGQGGGIAVEGLALV